MIVDLNNRKESEREDIMKLKHSNLISLTILGLTLGGGYTFAADDKTGEVEKEVVNQQNDPDQHALTTKNSAGASLSIGPNGISVDANAEVLLKVTADGKTYIVVNHGQAYDISAFVRRSELPSDKNGLTCDLRKMDLADGTRQADGTVLFSFTQVFKGSAGAADAPVTYATGYNISTDGVRIVKSTGTHTGQWIQITASGEVAGKIAANTNANEVSVKASGYAKGNASQQLGPVNLSEQASAGGAGYVGVKDGMFKAENKGYARASADLNDYNLAKGSVEYKASANIGKDIGADGRIAAEGSALDGNVTAGGSAEAHAHINKDGLQQSAKVEGEATVLKAVYGKGSATENFTFNPRKGMTIELETNGEAGIKTESATVLAAGVDVKLKGGITAKGILIDASGTLYMIANDNQGSVKLYLVAGLTKEMIGGEAGANFRFDERDHVLKAKAGIFDGELEGEVVGMGLGAGKKGVYGMFAGIQGGITKSSTGGLKFHFDLSRWNSWTGKFVHFFTGDRAPQGYHWEKIRDESGKKHKILVQD